MQKKKYVCNSCYTLQLSRLIVSSSQQLSGYVMIRHFMCYLTFCGEEM